MLENAEVVDGKRIADPTPFRERPCGVIHHLSGGRMAAPIAHSARAPMPGGRLDASDEDRLEAARTFMAHAARFEVGDDRVIHHVDVNSHPDDVGLNYVRLARLEGDVLELATPRELPADQRPMRLPWRRDALSGTKHGD